MPPFFFTLLDERWVPRFGEQLIKYVLEDLVKGGSPVIERATMVKNGHLTAHYDYLKEYAAH